ncbi:MAG TPA: hypothetical protein VLA88_01595 [Candidatus Saccharimonadales bacterium]|nr:hypothetical protein [Candidatus Saccharimonadales bacterium]
MIAMPAPIQGGVRRQIPIMAFVMHDTDHGPGTVDLTARYQLAGRVAYALSEPTARMVNAFLSLEGDDRILPNQIRSATGIWQRPPVDPAVPVQLDAMIVMTPGPPHSPFTQPDMVERVRQVIAADLLTVLQGERIRQLREDGADVMALASIQLVRSTLVLTSTDQVLGMELNPYTGQVVNCEDSQFVPGYLIPGFTPASK